MHLILGGVLCLIGIVAGQSIEASPSNRIAVGGTLNITCDSGDVSLPPNLFIDGRSTSNNQQVDNITPPGTANNLATFEFSSVTKENQGIVFTCRLNAPQGQSITLEVLFEPEISFNNQSLTVKEGESAPISFNVDANPAVTAENITVTIGGQPVGFNTSFNGTMVTVTLLNLRDSGQYQVKATNIVGMDSIAFQVNVISATSTMNTQSATSASMSSQSSSSSSDSSTMTSSSSMSVGDPSPTQPTGPTRSSATGLQASICFVLLLIIFVFMY